MKERWLAFKYKSYLGAYDKYYKIATYLLFIAITLALMTI